MWTKIAHLARVRSGRAIANFVRGLYDDGVDFLLEEETVVEENVRVVNSTHTVESPGQYMVAIRGDELQPGEVYFNDKLVVTVYGLSVDCGLLLYAMAGDIIEVVGAEHTVKKVEYA